jgi:hypothetical protein
MFKDFLFIRSLKSFNKLGVSMVYLSGQQFLNIVQSKINKFIRTKSI